MHPLILLLFLGLTNAFFHGGQHHFLRQNGADMIATNITIAHITTAISANDIDILGRLINLGKDTETLIYELSEALAANDKILIESAEFRKNSNERFIDAIVTYSKTRKIFELVKNSASTSGWTIIDQITYKNV